MRELAQAAGKAVTDLSQGVRACCLAEEHGDELGPAGKALCGAFGLVLADQGGEFETREVLKQLTEKASAAYHGSTL
jgi:hypothetical protein